MKALAAALTVVLLALTPGRADVVIVQKAKGPIAGDEELTMKVSGNRARVDVGRQFSSIMDLGSGHVTSLIHAQKVAMQLPTGALAELKGKMGQPGNKPDLKPTGRKETINGFACEEYTGSFQGLEVAYWVTNDVPNQKAILEQLGKLSGTGDPLQAALAGGGDFPGFPIRTVIKSPQMGESTVTVVSIKEDAVPATTFDIPSDYKTMEMPKVPGR